MRIALFTDTYSPQINGVTNTLTHLETYFEQRGIEYRILAPEYDVTQQRDRVDTFNSFRFFLYPECRLSLVNHRRVKQIMEGFRPDVVHMATEFNMGWAGLQYAQSAGLPVISTFTTNFPQYLQYYKLDILTDIVWDYFRWYHNQCNLTVCPSSETRNLLIGKGIPRTEIWGRGIDTTLYNPSKRNEALRRELMPEGGKLLLYVGRISPEKDLPVLFDAYSRLRVEAVEPITLAVAGDGPMREAWQTRYGESGVRFVGYKRGEALAELYASADAFVFPSATETLGNVVLEAMASGIPVIGVRSGGVLENIRHEENGLLCTPGDSESFYQAMGRLLGEPNLLRTLGKEALRYSRTKEWEQIFDQLIGHYTLAKANRRSSAA